MSRQQCHIQLYQFRRMNFKKATTLQPCACTYMCAYEGEFAWTSYLGMRGCLYVWVLRSWLQLEDIGRQKYPYRPNSYVLRYFLKYRSIQSSGMFTPFHSNIWVNWSNAERTNLRNVRHRCTRLEPMISYARVQCFNHCATATPRQGMTHTGIPQAYI